MGGGFAIAAAAVISPWAVRNFREFDQPIITTTHGGYTLALANNPLFYRHLAEQSWSAPWDSEPLTGWIEALHPSIFEEDELVQDRLYRFEALAANCAQPEMFVASCAYRLSRLWGICPLATDASESLKHRLLRYAVAAFYACEFVLAAWGACAVGAKLAAGALAMGPAIGAVGDRGAHGLLDRHADAPPLVPVIALAAGVGVTASRQQSRCPRH